MQRLLQGESGQAVRQARRHLRPQAPLAAGGHPPASLALGIGISTLPTTTPPRRRCQSQHPALPWQRVGRVHAGDWQAQPAPPGRGGASLPERQRCCPRLAVLAHARPQRWRSRPPQGTPQSRLHHHDADRAPSRPRPVRLHQRQHEQLQLRRPPCLQQRQLQRQQLRLPLPHWPSLLSRQLRRHAWPGDPQSKQAVPPLLPQLERLLLWQQPQPLPRQLLQLSPAWARAAREQDPAGRSRAGLPRDASRGQPLREAAGAG